MHKDFFAYMHVYAPYACVVSIKVNTDSLIPPGTEDTGGCELSYRSQEINPGSLQEQQVPKYLANFSDLQLDILKTYSMC